MKGLHLHPGARARSLLTESATCVFEDFDMADATPATAEAVPAQRSTLLVAVIAAVIAAGGAGPASTSCSGAVGCLLVLYG